MEAQIDLPIADGVYTLKLGPAQIREIQSKSGGIGIGKIYARTMAGRFNFGVDDFHPDLVEFAFDELVEILRQGLIGGKHGVVDGVDVLVTTSRANEIIANYVLDGPDRMILTQTWALAAKTIYSLFHGFDPPKKAEPAQQPAAATTDGSTTSRPKPTP